jgi:hypothetical protein
MELSVISVFCRREVAENRAVDTVALVQVYLTLFRQCHSTSAPHSHSPTLIPPVPHTQSPTLIPPVPHTQSPTLIPPVPHTHSHLNSFHQCPTLSHLHSFHQCPTLTVTYTHSTSALHSHSPTLIAPVPHTQSPTLIPPVPYTHTHLHSFHQCPTLTHYVYSVQAVPCTAPGQSVCIQCAGCTLYSTRSVCMYTVYRLRPSTVIAYSLSTKVKLMSPIPLFFQVGRTRRG